METIWQKWLRWRRRQRSGTAISNEILVTVLDYIFAHAMKTHMNRIQKSTGHFIKYTGCHSITQISQDTMTWQLLIVFRHIVMFKMICWTSNWAAVKSGDLSDFKWFKLFVPAVCSVFHKEISRVYRQSTYDLKKRKCSRRGSINVFVFFFCMFFGEFFDTRVQRRMARLLWADRKATIIQIIIHYD